MSEAQMVAVVLLAAVSLARVGRALASDPATTLETVEVTAPRAEAAAQQAPASITVLPAEQIQSAGIETTGDLGTRVPNLAVQEGGDRRSNIFSIRGLGNTAIAGTSVGLYVDGIPIVDVRAALIPLFDVQDAEILRGTQNLRFGRSADGGAINLITRVPPSVLSARASVQLGNHDTQIYEGAVGGPLGSDRVRFSIAGLESRRDGYVENTFLHEPLDDRDLLAGRGKLVLLPVDGLEIDLVGEAQHADEGSIAWTLQGQPDPFQVAYNTPGAEQTDTYLGALRASYAAPLFRLTSLTARRSFDASHSSFDLDFTPRNLLVLHDDHSYVDWTEELRVASPDPEGRWRWQAGGFFEDTVTRPDLGVQANSTPLIQAPPPQGLGLPFTAPVDDVQAARVHSRTLSGFGEATTTALTPVELTAGLRYQHDDVEMSRHHNLHAPSQGETVAAVPPFRLETQSSAWLPQLTAAYRMRPFLLAYVIAARGYRPGGFSWFVDDPRDAPFAPQREWSEEIGVKGSWLDGRVTSDLALFYVEARDFQVTQRFGFTGFDVLNAQRVTSRGLDASITAEPWTGLDLYAGVGYVDARYDEFRPASSQRPLDGNQVQLVPPYNFQVAVEYHHPTGVLARLAYRGNGAYPYTQENTAGQGAYELLDARLGWAGQHFGVSVFAANLTNVTYLPFGIPGGPGGRFIVAPGAPRTFGVEATGTF